MAWTSARLTASVVNGSITTVNLSMQDVSSSPTHLTGTLGSGLGTICLSTVNGLIEVAGY